MPVSSPSGLQVSHVAGGGVGVALGDVILSVLAHFGFSVSPVDALVIGGGALSAGAGLGHIIGRVGILGALRALLRGSGS